MENYTFTNNAKEQFNFFLNENDKLALNIRFDNELIAAFILSDEERDSLIRYLSQTNIIQKQSVGNYKGVDYYDGDKVLVKGTKKVGNYETEIIKDSQGWTLKENKTYLNDNKCFTAIIEKL